MSETYQTTAIAFGDLKNASLYFDHLVPVNLGVESINWVEFKTLTEGGNLAEMLPPDLVRHPGFGDCLAELNRATYNLLAKEVIKRFNFEPRIPGVSEEQFAAIENTVGEMYFEFLNAYELNDYPLATAGGVARASFLENPDIPLSPVLTLADFRVIDASHASWRQIAEFRRDHEARRKLRRLRLFAYENYAGRPRAFVEDDLLTRVADYEESVRQWGFETVQGALSAVLNSKLTAAIVGGSIISSLFGGSSQAVASIATGAAVQIGHVAVELTKQRFALQKLMRDNPVSFISYTRTKLGNPETNTR